MKGYCREMKKKDKLVNILGAAVILSLLLPVIGLRFHHDCRYDECFRIFYKGRLGICVENAVDKMFRFLAVLWYCVIMGSALVLSKNRDATSPWIIIGVIIALAVFGAFIDPAKWLFVIALLPSLTLFMALVAVDSRNTKK